MFWLHQRHRETERIIESHKGGRPLVISHADIHFIVNSAMWSWMMNATLLKAPKCHVRTFETTNISMVCVLDDLQGYLTTTPGTGIIVLHGPGNISAERGTSQPQCCSLMKVDSH